jgi:hypothetical protein
VRTTVSVWSRLPLRGSLQPRSVSRIRSEPIRPVHARFYPISTEHDGTEPDVNEPNGQLASRIPSSAASEPLNTTAQHATHLTTDQKVGDSSSPGRATLTWFRRPGVACCRDRVRRALSLEPAGRSAIQQYRSARRRVQLDPVERLRGPSRSDEAGRQNARSTPTGGCSTHSAARREPSRPTPDGGP